MDDDRCPPLKTDTMGICSELCGEDKPCNDSEVCCSNGCGHVCMPGIYGSCQPNKVPLNIHKLSRVRSSHVWVKYQSGLYSTIMKTGLFKYIEKFHLQKRKIFR